MVSDIKTEFCSSFKYSYQPSVPESAMDTLAVHAAAIAASDSHSKLSSTSVADLTRDLENISISRDLDDHAQDPLAVALEGDTIPDSIVLDSRINEESLRKFRPLANLPSRPKRHSRPDVDSHIDKFALPDKEDEKLKKANISRKLSLSTDSSTSDGSSSSAIEQSLIKAFTGIQIGSLKATVQIVESNRSIPKVLIKSETSSRLAGGQVNSTTSASKIASEHSKLKAIGPKV